MERLPWLPRARPGPGRTAYDRLTPARWVRQAEELWREYRFDVIMVEYVLISAVLDRIPGSVRKIVDTHDAFADRDERLSTVPKQSRWMTMTREDEATGLGRADFVLAIQDQEAAHFRKLTPKPVVIVDHLPGSIEPAPEPEGPPSLLMMTL